MTHVLIGREETQRYRHTGRTACGNGSRDCSDATTAIEHQG